MKYRVWRTIRAGFIGQRRFSKAGNQLSTRTTEWPLRLRTLDIFGRWPAGPDPGRLQSRDTGRRRKAQGRRRRHPASRNLIICALSSLFPA